MELVIIQKPSATKIKLLQSFGHKLLLNYKCLSPIESNQTFLKPIRNYL